MEKVKLTSEMAKALETTYSLIGDKDKMFYNVFVGDYDDLGVDFSKLDSSTQKELHESILKLEQLVQENPSKYYSALMNGYEIEQTPEDQLLEIYKQHENLFLKEWHPVTKERYHVFCQGIKVALDTLGVKIDGVNT